MKRTVIYIALFILAYKFLESNPFGRIFDAPQAQLTYSQASVNTAEALKIQQEALEIRQRIDRQNYMDDGIAINVGARTISGQGITPAEQIGTVLFTISTILIILFGAIIGIGGLLLLIRLTSSKTTIV